MGRPPYKEVWQQVGMGMQNNPLDSKKLDKKKKGDQTEDGEMN